MTRELNQSDDDAADWARRLEAKLAAWFEAVDLGVHTSLEAFCSDAPELIGPLQNLLEGEGGLHSLVAGLRPEQPSPAQDLVAGRYLIQERIGGGGAGSVHRATDLTLGRDVALKLLHPHHLDSESIRQRFEREAKVLAQLDHPAIVPVFDYRGSGDRPFLAMKLLDRSQLTPDKLPLPAERVAAIGRTIADGLNAAHQAGIIHRDVKPDNIVFDVETPRLVDFGLARANDGRRETHEGAFAGTMIYMSPEQFRGETRNLDGRTDIYSLGASLYEIANGHPPFREAKTSGENEDSIDIAVSILNEAPPPLGLDREHRDLELIIMACLQKERDNRYPTAADLSADLERFLRGEAIQWRPQSRIERLSRQTRRHPRIALALFLVFLVVLALGLNLWLQRARSQRALDEAAQRVRTTLESGKIADVERDFQMLLKLWPDSDTTRKLKASVDLARARESILDFIQRRDGAHDLAQGEAATATLQSLRSPPSPFDRILLGLAYYLMGDDEKARAITRLRDDVVGEWLRQLLVDEPIAIDRAALEGIGTEDALLLALIATLDRETEFADREWLVERAMGSKVFRHRALAEQARLLGSSGNPQAMRAIFRTLGPGYFRPSFYRYLKVASHITSGSNDKAVRIIEQVPEAQRSVDDRAQLAVAQIAMGELEQANEVLSTVDLTTSRHIGILRAACRLARLKRRFAEASDLAQRLVDLSHNTAGSLTDRLIRTGVRIDMISPSLIDQRRALSREEAEEARTLVKELEDISRQATFPNHVGLAQQQIFLACLALGEDTAAFEAIDQAARRLPNNLEVNAMWLTVAGRYADKKDLPRALQRTFGSHEALLLRSAKVADGFILLGRPDPSQVNATYWDQTLLVRSVIAMYDDDELKLREFIEKMEENFPPTSRFRKNLPVFKRALKMLERGESVRARRVDLR